VLLRLLHARGSPTEALPKNTLENSAYKLFAIPALKDEAFSCKRLGISFITLKRWIYSGRIKAIRTPTGRWMIPESEIERIIRGGYGA
jgi:hypothetical protein